MANPHPNQSGLRPAWRRGEYPGSRISNKAAKAIRLARQHCPAAILYATRVMNDESESTQLRLKAADLILAHGMPRGDTSRYTSEETIGGITLTFVTPEEVAEKRRALIEGEALTEETETVGSGD